MAEQLDHFARVPLRFTEALRADEIDDLQHNLGCYIAARCYEANKTHDGIATIRLSELTELFRTSDDTISRKLHDMEPDWIECDVKPGQRAWRIWLTGLVIRDPEDVQAPQALRKRSAPEPPPVRSLTSAESASPDGANPHGKTDSDPPQAPQTVSRQDDRREEKRRLREKTTHRSEEKLDHVVGEDHSPGRAVEVDEVQDVDVVAPRRSSADFLAGEERRMAEQFAAEVRRAR